jgi:hypothetical protein
MNLIFKHFIITRFNIVPCDDSIINDDSQVTDEAYLSERFRLFDLYCFPSVKNQTNKNFAWLCLFYDQTPEKWKLKIDEYKAQLPNFTPIFCSYEQRNGSKELLLLLDKTIKTEVNKSASHPNFILTTRIDNDDAIHKLLINNLQNYFLEPQEEMVLNYANGLHYIPQYNVLKNYINEKGHFCTLIETNSQCVKTVLSFPHNDLPSSLKSVCLKEKTRMWIEIIHRTNELNTTYFQMRCIFCDLFGSCFRYKDLSDFGIIQQLPRFNFSVWKLFFIWFFSGIWAKALKWRK